jgi:hypothetical protein
MFAPAHRRWLHANPNDVDEARTFLCQGLLNGDLPSAMLGGKVGGVRLCSRKSHQHSLILTEYGRRTMHGAVRVDQRSFAKLTRFIGTAASSSDGFSSLGSSCQHVLCTLAQMGLISRQPVQMRVGLERAVS